MLYIVWSTTKVNAMNITDDMSWQTIGYAQRFMIDTRYTPVNIFANNPNAITPSSKPVN